MARMPPLEIEIVITPAVPRALTEEQLALLSRSEGRLGRSGLVEEGPEWWFDDIAALIQLVREQAHRGDLAEARAKRLRAELANYAGDNAPDLSFDVDAWLRLVEEGDDKPKLAEVVALEPRPDPELVANLERLLADVRAGRVLDVAVAGTMTEGCVITFHSGKGDLARLLGALQVVQSRVLAQYE